MEIFEASGLTGTAWSAAQLTGCDAKTVARCVAVRDAGGDPLARAVRPRLIDAFMPKIEELVGRSKGKIRTDVAHRKITVMGYRGSERSTRRAVAEVKQAWQAGRRRRYRPWVPEPGMWLQWDWGDGPLVRGRTWPGRRPARYGRGGDPPGPGRSVAWPMRVTVYPHCGHAGAWAWVRGLPWTMYRYPGVEGEASLACEVLDGLDDRGRDRARLAR